MGVGRLEVFCGGMFASKSTELQRQGKRHMIAGRKVVMLKPSIDGRYGDGVVATHDGSKMKAINVRVDMFINYLDDITPSSSHPAIREADVICIDEVQFFPPLLVQYIDELIYAGKLVYVAGLDLNSDGQPFGIMPTLMAKAERVEKYSAVCTECGEDAWVSVATGLKEDEVQVGNGYKPMCRSCSVQYIGSGK